MSVAERTPTVIGKYEMNGQPMLLIEWDQRGPSKTCSYRYFKRKWPAKLIEYYEKVFICKYFEQIHEEEEEEGEDNVHNVDKSTVDSDAVSNGENVEPVKNLKRRKSIKVVKKAFPKHRKTIKVLKKVS